MEVVLRRKVTTTLVAPTWQAVWGPNLSRMLNEHPHVEHRPNPAKLEAAMLQDHRVILQALCCPPRFIETVVRYFLKKNTILL